MEIIHTISPKSSQKQVNKPTCQINDKGFSVKYLPKSITNTRSPLESPAKSNFVYFESN